MHRILDLSEEPAALSVRHDNLVVTRDGHPDVAIPLPEVAVLVVSHPQVHYTHAVLSGLVAAGGVFVTCDERRLPAGMLLPIQGHTLQARRMAAQVDVKLPVKKRLWQEIVRAKIRAQGALLRELHGEDCGLGAMAGRVRSGDPDNKEAQAARRYWMALFDPPGSFVRNPEAGDANRFLNYGYAVLRAIVARAIVASGLHPSVGLHHHNQYNAFVLADDLIEPFRPLVDRVVVHLVAWLGADAPLDRDAKAELISAMQARYEIDGESRTLFDVASRLAASLAAVFLGERTRLVLPDVSRLPVRCEV